MSHDKGTVDVARDIQIGLATEFHPAFALGPLADFQFRSGIEPYDRTVGKHRFGLLTDRRGERSELQVRRRIIPEIFGEICLQRKQRLPLLQATSSNGGVLSGASTLQCHHP